MTSFIIISPLEYRK